MAHQILDIRTVHPTRGYHHAARVGNLLFVAGQVAKDLSGEVVGVGDFAAQAAKVHENLAAVLAEAGGRMDQIVKLTTYLTHFDYVETYRTVRDRYVAEPMPPNTLVIVESLADPRFLIEIEAIAALD